MRGSGFLKPILAELDDVIEQCHHFGDVERSAAAASDRVGGKIIGDAAGLEPRLHKSQSLNHLGAQIARQQRQDVLASNLRAQRQRFRREQPVEGLDVHFGAFEFCPGILPMVGGVGAPDNIGGQPAFVLETRKGLERRGGEHPAEVPDHRSDHYFPSCERPIGRTANTVSRRGPARRGGLAPIGSLARLAPSCRLSSLSRASVLIESEPGLRVFVWRVFVTRTGARFA